MDKEYILAEIKRTAQGNDGIPLGIDRFQEATGIRKTDWYGKFWAKWTDAQVEAGFERNPFGSPAIDEQWLLHVIAKYTRELGQFPTRAEFDLLHRRDSSFPTTTTLRNRFGSKFNIISRVLDFCRTNHDLDDVVKICESLKASLMDDTQFDSNTDEKNTKKGYVYLIQHGNRKEYKIGKTYNIIRREGEIRLELPEKVKPIHTIATDDPSGIEHYWHNRFAKKRKEGEWFQLDASDILAFKRWRKIY